MAEDKKFQIEWVNIFLGIIAFFAMALYADIQDMKKDVTQIKLKIVEMEAHDSEQSRNIEKIEKNLK